MSLTNPNKVITEERLSEFYQSIFPYLGGMPEILANKFNKSDLYSTSEKMIGQWIDGKPLYQKTFQTTSPSQVSVSTAVIDLSSSGIDKIVDLKPFIYDNSNMTIHGNGFVCWVRYAVPSASQNFEVACQVTNQSYLNDTMLITLQYTKTTDSPVSIGNDTDYSTTEKIVGTWIDGKPIYQKTVECGALPNNTTKNVAHNITNISEWISITGISYVNNSGKGGMSLPLVYHNSSSVNNCLLQANSENIILRTEGDRSPYDVTYVTLQYTKTTD